MYLLTRYESDDTSLNQEEQCRIYGQKDLVLCNEIGKLLV